VQLLARPGGGSLAALAAALPSPPVPADEQRVAELADGRTGGRQRTDLRREMDRPPGTLLLGAATSWTPGIR
jgi:hypothetical protein